MTITAIYKNGVFQPLEDVTLSEDSEVTLTIEAAKPLEGHPGLMPLLAIARKYPRDPNPQLTERHSTIIIYMARQSVHDFRRYQLLVVPSG